jgi:hypothetical protein
MACDNPNCDAMDWVQCDGCDRWGCRHCEEGWVTDFKIGERRCPECEAQRKLLEKRK